MMLSMEAIDDSEGEEDVDEFVNEASSLHGGESLVVSDKSAHAQSSKKVKDLMASMADGCVICIDQSPFVKSLEFDGFETRAEWEKSGVATRKTKIKINNAKKRSMVGLGWLWRRPLCG